MADTVPGPARATVGPTAATSSGDIDGVLRDVVTGNRELPLADAIVSGACARCAMRLVSVQNYNAYLTPNAALNRALRAMLTRDIGEAASGTPTPAPVPSAGAGGAGAGTDGGGDGGGVVASGSSVDVRAEAVAALETIDSQVCACCLGVLQVGRGDAHHSLQAAIRKTRLREAVAPGAPAQGAGAAADQSAAPPAVGAASGGAAVGADADITMDGSADVTAAAATAQDGDTEMVGGSGDAADSSADTAVLTTQASRMAVKMLRDKKYKLRLYQLGISLPTSCLIRDYSMWQYLHDKYSSMREGSSGFMHVCDLKSVVKAMTSNHIEAAYPGAACTLDGDIIVDLVCRHPTADPEALTFLGKALRPARRKRQRIGAGARDKYANSAGVSFKAISAAVAKARVVPPGVPSPPTRSGDMTTLDVEVQRRPIYFKGNYAKFARGVSQTHWSMGGEERKGETSVHEEIAGAVEKAFGSTVSKFHSAGREDIDVRMLGAGRPFVLELVDAQESVESLGPAAVGALERAINAGSHLVQVRHFVPCTKSEFESLSRGADSKRKRYVCVVWVSRAIKPADLAALNTDEDVVVQQITPVRVVHRRSLLTRPKVIHSMSTEYINQHFFTLHLTTSAGTYVKEFVHGDLGRTTPNVGELLDCDADILQLDVEGLIMLQRDPTTGVQVPVDEGGDEGDIPDPCV